MFCLSRNTCRRFALGLLFVFATLFSGNTFFVHSHIGLDGRTIAHSHPFLPGSCHGHSSQQTDAINHINLALMTAELSETTELTKPVEGYIVLTESIVADMVDNTRVTISGRAPPIV